MSLTPFIYWENIEQYTMLSMAHKWTQTQNIKPLVCEFHPASAWRSGSRNNWAAQNPCRLKFADCSVTNGTFAAVDLWFWRRKKKEAKTFLCLSAIHLELSYLCLNTRLVSKPHRYMFFSNNSWPDAKTTKLNKSSPAKNYSAGHRWGSKTQRLCETFQMFRCSEKTPRVRLETSGSFDYSETPVDLHCGPSEREATSSHLFSSKGLKV